ncbi:MAG: NAD(P)/FAD-dependent oxidoreductase [Myxococcales bacterium]|nr:MAG: NAD(P)/FAD-dependent oxidoreductase [Myxococcales bacterium]
MRTDGNEQYVEVGGRFAHFVDDPYVDRGFEREPLTDEVDVVVIGGGFGGLLAGTRLREAGVENVRIIEKGGDFGGTWYWNRYPGIACDIESYVYLPLLEELEYVPREKYSRGAEIFDHCKAIAERYDLYRDVCFQTEVTEVRWEAGSERWIVSTNRDDAIKARFICLANGFLQKPKLPGVPGVETFKGHTFHTSRWDYDYTGGDANGDLTGLRDKRVGIIGTGASAVQCIPHLGESAGHLYVFQRTPSSVDVRANRPTDPEWAASLEPGWHEKRMENFQILTAGGYQEEDLVNDGWTDIIRKLLKMMLAEADPDLSPEALARTVEMADFAKMEQVRARVDSLVEDPATAEALKPYYRQFCKRPCFHDGYLQTFNRPNVTLVDTQGVGVERVTEKGVVVTGEEYELDCLIFATGFEVGTDYSRRSGYGIVGRDGLTLTEKWGDGIRTLHGMHMNGFPNCFMMMVSQAGFTVNFPYMINEQAKHIAYIIARALGEGIRSVEVSEEAESEWVETVIEMGERTIEFAEQCTPGYYNNEGKPSRKTRQGGFYFGGPTEFTEILEGWRTGGELKVLQLRR